MDIENKKPDIQNKEFNVKKSVIFNIPNRITLSRLLLAIVFFVLLTHRHFNVALVIFFVAVATDWLMDIWPENGNYQQTWGALLILLLIRLLYVELLLSLLVLQKIFLHRGW